MPPCLSNRLLQKVEKGSLDSCPDWRIVQWGETGQHSQAGEWKCWQVGGGKEQIYDEETQVLHSHLYQITAALSLLPLYELAAS